MNPGKFGQFPSFAGSPPILTNCPTDGIPPFSTNIMYHPGGAICEFGGAVTCSHQYYVSPSVIRIPTYCATRPRARNSRKQRSLPHTVPVRRTHTSQQTNLNPPHATRERYTRSVRPILVRNRERRPCCARKNVGRREDFDAVFLWPGVGIRAVISCWVGT